MIPFILLPADDQCSVITYEIVRLDLPNWCNRAMLIIQVETQEIKWHGKEWAEVCVDYTLNCLRRFGGSDYSPVTISKAIAPWEKETKE